MTHDGSAYLLPQSVHHIPGSASSSSPAALFRNRLASDSARAGETLDQVRTRRGTIAFEPSDHRPRPPRPIRLSETTRTGDAVVAGRGAVRRWGRYALAIRRWERITGRPPQPQPYSTTAPGRARQRTSWNGSWGFRMGGRLIRTRSHSCAAPHGTRQRSPACPGRARPHAPAGRLMSAPDTESPVKRALGADR
jgi:hypothetical protein